MRFYTPPCCEGQTIEVSYASAADFTWLYRAQYDRSSHECTVERAAMDADDDYWIDYCPWQHRPAEPDSDYLPAPLYSDGDHWYALDVDGSRCLVDGRWVDGAPYGSLLPVLAESCVGAVRSGDRWLRLGERPAFMPTRLDCHHWRGYHLSPDRQELGCERCHEGEVIVEVGEQWLCEACHDACSCGAVAPLHSLITGNGECLCEACAAEQTEEEEGQ
jgi:hypothetical protein